MLSKDELVKRIEIKILENQEAFIKDLAKEAVGNGDRGYSYGLAEKLVDRIVDRVAEKFFMDHYPRIAEKIDVERVAKMAELSIINRTRNGGNAQ
jgi:hypothetical protein